MMLPASLLISIVGISSTVFAQSITITEQSPDIIVVATQTVDSSGSLISNPPLPTLLGQSIPSQSSPTAGSNTSTLINSTSTAMSSSNMTIATQYSNITAAPTVIILPSYSNNTLSLATSTPIPTKILVAPGTPTAIAQSTITSVYIYTPASATTQVVSATRASINSSQSSRKVGLAGLLITGLAMMSLLS